jgi:hypothetical protein
MRHRAALSALVVALAAAGCQRAPEEPVRRDVTPALQSAPPRPSETATASAAPLASSAPAPLASSAPAPLASSAPARADRCIDPMPDAPPPKPPPGPAPGCPADPEKAPPLAKAPVAVAGTQVKVTAEIAKTEKDVTRGLMYRTRMTDDEGMLFHLDSRRLHAFWMHNTCIPLDMLFVDEDGTIVGIVENAPTLNDEERKVRCPSLYVLEVNAGWSRRKGVKPGQKLAIPDAAK